MMVPQQVFCDGGIIGRYNPSLVGGTWAYCFVANGNLLGSFSGVVIPRQIGYDPEIPQGMNPVPITLPSVENNVTEFIAAVKALTALPAGWSGEFFTDSQITIGRLFGLRGKKWAMAGIPAGWSMRADVALSKLGNITPILLDGHPTRAQVASGIGKRGNRCSGFNVLCDTRCNERSAELLEANPSAVVRSIKEYPPQEQIQKDDFVYFMWDDTSVRFRYKVDRIDKAGGVGQTKCQSGYLVNLSVWEGDLEKAPQNYRRFEGVDLDWVRFALPVKDKKEQL